MSDSLGTTENRAVAHIGAFLPHFAMRQTYGKSGYWPNKRAPCSKEVSMANTGRRASPQWRSLYEAAVLELNHDKLRERIAEARHAILDRMEDLSRSKGGTEDEELMNALTVLGDLRKVADSTGVLQY
jgi:hypothetical protein